MALFFQITRHNSTIIKRQIIYMTKSLAEIWYAITFEPLCTTTANNQINRNNQRAIDTRNGRDQVCSPNAHQTLFHANASHVIEHWAGRSAHVCLFGVSFARVYAEPHTHRYFSTTNHWQRCMSVIGSVAAMWMNFITKPFDFPTHIALKISFSAFADKAPTEIAHFNGCEACASLCLLFYSGDSTRQGRKFPRQSSSFPCGFANTRLPLARMQATHMSVIDSVT